MLSHAFEKVASLPGQIYDQVKPMQQMLSPFSSAKDRGAAAAQIAMPGIQANADAHKRNAGPVETGASTVAPYIGTDPTKLAQASQRRDTSGMLDATSGTWAPMLAGKLAGETTKAFPEATSAIQDAAVGDRTASALTGLGVGPKSPKGVRMVRNIEASRPYLGGVENQADLQSRVPIAKAEIIKPYADAVASLKDKVVSGPEGRTTVGALDAKRNELSAQLDSLRGKSPEQQAILLRQGKTPTDLIAEKRAVEKALLPEIAQTGIDPQAILRQYGQVSEVGRTVSGRTTLAAPEKPYGFGKMAQFDIAHPFQAPANIASGVRDIAAGRPLWSGKPTDINIREGFGGPALQKPDFGQFTPQPVRNQFGGLSQVEGPATPYQSEMVTPEMAKNSATNQGVRRKFGPTETKTGPPTEYEGNPVTPEESKQESVSRAKRRNPYR
jgi:hypothetical protein